MTQNTVFVCNGCCCGHTEKGNPFVKKDLFRELLAKEGLAKNIAMEVPYCLGPCNLANVVKATLNGKTYWFKRINTEEDVHAVIAFLKNPAEIPGRLQLKQVFWEV